MGSTKIAPSMLAADFANLERDINMVNQSQADWFHIDIMDGVFCSQYFVWNACAQSNGTTC